jgi:hypothetical protein
MATAAGTTFGSPQAVSVPVRLFINIVGFMLLGGVSRRVSLLCMGTLLAGSAALAGAPAAVAKTIPLISATPDRTVGFDGLVYASVHVGTTVYLGGNFTHAFVGGKPVARKRLAAVDTRSGKLLPWAPLSDGTVMALAVAGRSLYLTGRFTAVGGKPRNGLAAVSLADGDVGSLAHDIRGTGQALAAAGGRLYVGGDFHGVDKRPARNLAAFRLSDGSLDTGFRGGADALVRVLNADGGRVYVGGDFKRVNGTAGTARLAALRASDGQVDRDFRPGTPYPVFALTVTSGRVFAALGGPGGRVVAYKPDGKHLWSSVTDGDVQAIAYLNGVVYAGGHFTVACPQISRTPTSWCPTDQRKQPKIGAWDPATGRLLGWNPRSNGRWGVLTIDADPTRRAITVGGDFTAFGSADRPRFAQFAA